MARIHTHPDYYADLDAARKEFVQHYKGNLGAAVSFPNSRRILDAPFDTASRRYYADINAHWIAKSERATLRGYQAIADADNSIDAMLLCFSQSMGLALSRQHTPHIFALLNEARQTLVEQSEALKNTVSRKRPYVQLGEKTIMPQYEERYRNTSSYVSTHAAIGWGLSLLLAELNPDHQDAILQRGFEYGYSRVIAGYQYASDVQAARLVASYSIGRLHADPAFRTLIDNARNEYKQLTGRHIPQKMVEIKNKPRKRRK
jgi:acid phosphatase (class A)